MAIKKTLATASSMLALALAGTSAQAAGGGVIVESGGTMTLSGTTVSTSGKGADAVVARDEGSVMTLTDSIVSTDYRRGPGGGNAGIDTHALLAEDGGNITGTGLTITGSNDGYFDGVVSVRAGSTITLADSSISNEMPYADFSAAGATAAGAEAVLTLNGTSVSVASAKISNGSSAGAIGATDGGTVNINKGAVAVAAGDRDRIESTGNWVRGIVAANGTGNIVDANNVAITTTGDNGHGVQVGGGSLVRLSNAGIHTTGNNAEGVTIFTVDGETAQFVGHNLDITTEGRGADGVVAEGAGSSALVTGGTTIAVTGAGAYGVSAVNGGAITLDGASVSANGRAFSAVGGAIGAANVALSATMASGNVEETGAVYALNGGTATLDGGRIDATGGRVNGLFALTDGTIGTRNVAITASGDRARGAYASADETGGGMIGLTGGTIETNGLLAHGLFAKRESGTTANSKAWIIASNVAITVAGTDANGVYADVGGIIDITGGSVATTGLRGHALHAQKGDDGMTGAGILTATGVTIATGGTGAIGGYAEKGGSLAIDGGSITTAGSLAYGLVARDAGSTVSSSANITTQGDWTFGAYAVDGGAIALTGGIVTTHGERAHGLLAEKGGSIASSATVATHGDRAHGAVAGTAAGGGDILLAGGTISTTGDHAYGLQAFQGTITGKATISTAGAGAFGVAADGDGHITLTGGQVTTSGAGAYGLLAVYDARAVSAGIVEGKIDVTTAGAGAHGALAHEGGAILLTGGTIHTTGAGASGLAASGALAGQLSSVTASNARIVTDHADAAGLAIAGTGTISLTNSVVTSAGPAMAAAMTDGSTARFTVTGSTVTAGNGVLLDVRRDAGGKAGIVEAHFAGGSVLTGDIRDSGTKGTGYTDVTLDGAELRGALAGVRTLSLAHGGMWSATGNGDVASLAIGANGGVINTLASAVTISGPLTGAGALTKTGAGTLRIAGDNGGFTGTTTIDAGTLLLTGSLASDVTIKAAGTLQVGDGGKSGDLTGDTRNDGTLIFARSDDYDYIGALSGTGSLIKRGDGLLLLSGDYRYTGSTTIEGGRVKLASALDSATDLAIDGGELDLGDRTQEVAGLSGAGGTIALGTTGALTVNQSEDSSFAGSLAGSGTFTKTGSGSLNLTGVSSFTGAAHVDGGRLAVNGTLPADVAVNAGGTLGGNGTVGRITANEGGTVAPGNSIGTLHVTGDVAFGAGSVYAVEVDADGNSDRIVASGTAHLTGGTVSVLAAAGNYRWTSDYVILTAAGGIDGQFAGTDVDLPFLTPSLGYGLNDVTLTLVRNDRTFVSAATTANQRAVAAALDGSATTGGLYRAVAGQTDEAGAAQAFDALSGEIWASLSTLLVDQSRRSGELVLGRLREADGVTRALAGQGSAARETHSGGTAVWGQAIGAWNRLKSDGNAAPVSHHQFGFITGLDTAIGAWRLGAAFGHNEAKVRVDQRASSATATTSTVAIYAGGGWGNLRLHAGGAYAWHDVDGRRDVTFPGFTETVTASYDGKSLSGFAELSYAAQLGQTTVEPFAGVNHVHLKSDPFTEAGSSAALEAGRIKRDVTFTSLGLRLGTQMPLSDRAVLTPRLSAAWQHGFGDVTAHGPARLASGAAFSAQGLPLARNALLLEGGATANILPGGSLSLAYTGNIASRWSDHGLKIGFSYGF